MLTALLVLQLATADADPDVLALQAAAPTETAEAVAPPLSAETEASLQDAHDEPVLAELAVFLDAVHDDLGTAEVVLATTLRPYFLDLVQRMNAEQDTYRATLFAPRAALADRRADRLRTLFLDAGLAPDLLALTGRMGSNGVIVERP